VSAATKPEPDETARIVSMTKAILETWEDRERKACERLKPKEIAAALGISRQHVWRLVKAGKMPLDLDPAIGPCIQRADLERWRRNRTRSMEGLQTSHGTKHEDPSE